VSDNTLSSPFTGDGLCRFESCLLYDPQITLSVVTVSRRIHMAKASGKDSAKKSNSKCPALNDGPIQGDHHWVVSEDVVLEDDAFVKSGFTSTHCTECGEVKIEEYNFGRSLAMEADMMGIPIQELQPPEEDL